jgi:hypothetical protein
MLATKALKSPPQGAERAGIGKVNKTNASVMTRTIMAILTVVDATGMIAREATFEQWREMMS